MRNTTFYQHLVKDREKKELFEHNFQRGHIEEFPSSIMTRLRRSYFGYTTGLLYLYGEDTTFATIGNKVQLLCNALVNDDYKIVHGDTDSTRQINFNSYHQEHLDYNSWIEVKRGNKTFVYDLFSLLKYDKDLYYQLEHPEIRRIIPKSLIESHPSHEEDDFSRISGEFMLVGYIPMMEKKLKSSPYQDILKPELTRLRQIAGYDDIVLEWNNEKRQIKKI